MHKLKCDWAENITKSIKRKVYRERLSSTRGLCLKLGPYPKTLPLIFLMSKGADPWEHGICYRKKMTVVLNFNCACVFPLSVFVIVRYLCSLPLHATVLI